MTQVAINGQIWNYEEIKEGRTGGRTPPLLVLHGWGRSSAEWIDLAHRMSRSSARKVYVVDLPGFGGSSLPTVKDIYQYSELVKKFCDYIGIKKVTLIGHSLGGRIGIVLGAKHEELVEKLILIDPAGVKPKSFKRIILKSVAKILGWVPKYWKQKVLDQVMDADYLNTPTLRELYRAVVGDELTPLLSQIKCETTVIWGEKDLVLPLSLTKVYRDKISNCRVRVVWEAGHDPHLTHPRELLRILEEIWT